MRSWRWVVLLIVWCGVGLGAYPVRAQDASAAGITTPLPGATIAGQVAILGAAAPAQFERYELAFSYAPDPTNTWFSIQEPVLTPMPGGLLGRWDTTGIADGLYVLRLRVYTSEREYIETVVRGLVVQNTAPLPAASPPPVPITTAQASPTEPLALPSPTSLAPLIALPPAATPRPAAEPPSAGASDRPAAWPLSVQAAQAAFGAGAQLAVAVFALFGLYLSARAIVMAAVRRQRR